jgi:hypothetical protein
VKRVVSDGRQVAIEKVAVSHEVSPINNAVTKASAEAILREAGAHGIPIHDETAALDEREVASEPGAATDWLACRFSLIHRLSSLLPDGRCARKRVRSQTAMIKSLFFASENMGVGWGQGGLNKSNCMYLEKLPNVSPDLFRNGFHDFILSRFAGLGEKHKCREQGHWDDDRPVGHHSEIETVESQGRSRTPVHKRTMPNYSNVGKTPEPRDAFPALTIKFIVVILDPTDYWL